jgi:general secretion pathway protein E
MYSADTAINNEAQYRLSLEMVLKDLIDEGIMDVQDADGVRASIRPRDRNEKHPLELIGEQNIADQRSPGSILTTEALTIWLAEKSGLPYKRIDPLKLDVTAITDIVSYAYACRHDILPVQVLPGKVIIATSEPNLTGWIPELSRILKKDIELVVSNPYDIERYRLEFFGVSQSVKGATTVGEGAQFLNLNNLEQLVELGQRGSLDANDQHVVNIVDWLLQYAFEQRASDIHLEPRRHMGRIRFRIDGVLTEVYQVPGTVMSAITSRIKSLGRMDVAEKRKPQDGRVKTVTPENKEVEMRLSTMPTAFGEKMVMRIFNPDVLVKSFRELGFGKEDAAHWKDMTSTPNGIILVTGPTGSGKTTTLYSTLKTLAKPEVNVCTVEDPIEMIEPSFNQMQVQHNIDLDFASGIRTLMRQDPDIIMVGEIRDLETAEMAIQAALTGHLVLSTLHTNDAPSAITRLLDLGVPYYLIKATILGVVAQRLVRTLCPHCKEPHTPDREQWNSLVSPWKVPLPTHAMGPVGCLECRNTGYLGRIGLYEIMRLSPEMRELVVPHVEETAIRQLGYKQGMRPLRISGAEKINAGISTLEEVFKVAPMSQD